MLVRAFAGLTLAALLAAAPEAALAQAAPSAPPSPRALALAHQYMQVMHIEETNKKMLASMFGGMRGTAGSGDPRFNAAMDGAQDTIGALVEKLSKKMEPMVAETYTEQELKAMVDFYGSPIGQSVVEKGPVIAGKLSAASMDMMREMMAARTAPACSGAGCPPKP